MTRLTKVIRHGDNTEQSLTACFFQADISKPMQKAHNFRFKNISAWLPEHVTVDTLNDRAESLFSLEPRLYS